MILFSLTSSRIDSIRAQQHLVIYNVVLFIIHVKEPVTNQHSLNKVLELANILGSWTFSALGYIKADPITLRQ